VTAPCGKVTQPCGEVSAPLRGIFEIRYLCRIVFRASSLELKRRELYLQMDSHARIRLRKASDLSCNIAI
jgi:hypothetical protein